MCLYKMPIRTVTWYGSKNWTLKQAVENLIVDFEREILILGPVGDENVWRMRWKNKLYGIFDDPPIIN